MRRALPYGDLGQLCPFDLKSKSLLERRGYTVEDNMLESRDAIDAVKRKYAV